jgi:hypothetical protein
MIAVVHLVWGPLGVERLRRFLASYQEYPAGVEHDLLILLNGVGPELADAYRVELDGVEHRVVSLKQPLQDLAAYAWAADSFHYDRFCFLNSYSVILAPQWLAKLDAALSQRAVGLVGASGSWGSFHSAALDTLRLPNHYRKIERPSRERSRELAKEIDHELDEVDLTTADAPADRARTGLARGLTRGSDRLRRLTEYLIYFPGFPSEHLRTNSFMAAREALPPLRSAALATKADALRFESGRANYTRRLHAQGLRALVVDRAGDCFEAARWPASHTFWQADQEGLMIADNRTLTYTNGQLERRAMLSAFAWGAQAEPRV